TKPLTTSSLVLTMRRRPQDEMCAKICSAVRNGRSMIAQCAIPSALGCEIAYEDAYDKQQQHRRGNRRFGVPSRVDLAKTVRARPSGRCCRHRARCNATAPGD